MKILYLGHYRENSGWSRATLHHILSLSSVGVDVICRNIPLTSNNTDPPSKILELEKKKLDNVDYCIQHLLPHHIVGSGKFKKNVAFCPFESVIDKNHSWLQYFKMVDELWVPNSSNQKMLQDIEIKSKVIPYSFDTESYTKARKELNFGLSKNKFKFYFIGDGNSRKNIDGILRCYFSEFTLLDNVCLVLKLNSKTFNREQFYQKIDTIKKQLRIHSKLEYYPQVLVLNQDLSDDDIHNLHHSCNCYLGISHGEGWSIPAYEAMCYGNTPICSNDGGPKDFINESDPSTGSLISGVYSVCNHEDPAFGNIFTGKEEWFIPSESETKKKMRWYLENANSIDRSAGLKYAQRFNYKNVGRIIQEALDE